MQQVMHVDNFEKNNYEALLHPIVDMFFKLIKILNENRLIVNEKSVRIKDADYKSVNFYPEI